MGLGYYVKLEKIAEDDDAVVYSFHQAENKGTLRLMKSTGKIFVLEESENCSEEIIKRAGWKLSKHWHNGEYPDQTDWVS